MNNYLYAVLGLVLVLICIIQFLSIRKNRKSIIDLENEVKILNFEKENLENEADLNKEKLKNILEESRVETFDELNVQLKKLSTELKLRKELFHWPIN